MPTTAFSWRREASLRYSTCPVPAQVRFSERTPGIINDSGTVMGVYADDMTVWHPFVRTKNGELTTFEVPGHAPGDAVWPGSFYGFNQRGMAMGTYLDPDNVTHGWVRSQQGLVTE